MAADPNQPILFDCPGGDQWDDGVYSGIHQIIVAYGDVAIDSIHIQYDNNGRPSWSELGRRDRNRNLRSFRLEPRRRAGNQIGKIRLNYPREILTKISGRYDTYLRSLTFETNVKKYGPYGSERGNAFESPDGDWKIVGFRGRSHSYLQRRSFSCFYCIAVSLSFFPQSVKPISVGPWGGDSGDMWDDGVHSGIHQIIVVYDENGGAIGSIDIEYDNNGSRFWLGHGRSTGNKIEKIQLNYPTEILTSISGYYNSYYNARGILRGIRSLTFKSNLNEHGPYGREVGTHFSIPIPNGNGKIVGLYGRSDEFLRCIGVYLSRLDIAVHPMCVKVGPWGESERGDLWDDGAFSGILGIRVLCHYHERGRDHGRAIGSICFEYDDNGRQVLSDVHGNNNGQLERTPLDHGVTSISGYYDDTCITSLTFGTSGNEEFDRVTLPAQTRSPLWTHFSIPIGNVKIVGFHGRSDEYLRCIGVYLSN